jgi:mRNA interferase RelE/StbE
MYTIRFADDAINELMNLDRATAKRIMSKISWLAQNADTIEPLGLRGELAGFSKLRIGDYRVIYELIAENKILNIHFVGHRSEIYKQ